MCQTGNSNHKHCIWRVNQPPLVQRLMLWLCGPHIVDSNLVGDSYGYELFGEIALKKQPTDNRIICFERHNDK